MSVSDGEEARCGPRPWPVQLRRQSPLRTGRPSRGAPCARLDEEAEWSPTGLVIQGSSRKHRTPPRPTLDGMTAPDSIATEPQDLALLEDRELQLARSEEEESDPSPEPVSYSGTDFDVEGLVRRLERGDIVVPSFGVQDQTVETAGFQRSFVWRRPQMDRFIESLLLGYPVPGIMFVQQKDRRYLVLDGQQRLRTLLAFYTGIHEGVEFALKNVADALRGLTYKSLDAERKRTLDNSFLQATILKTDGSDSSLEAIYQIFERLNSGGTQLTAHEIRVALYSGPFIEFLTHLNEHQSWRVLYGQPSPRLRDQELILRFIALYISPGEYRRPLKRFLNDFVNRHRDMSEFDRTLVEQRFGRATSLLEQSVGREGLRTRGGAINAALTEALLVGLARRLDIGTEPNSTAVEKAAQAIVVDTSLQQAISSATADEESVRTRLAIATKSFSAA